MTKLKLIIAAMLLTVILPGCTTKESEILRTIPSDAPVVARIDMDLLKKAVDLDNPEIQEKLDRMMGLPSEDVLSLLTETARADELFIFLPDYEEKRVKNFYPVTTFMLEDRDGFIMGLEERGAELLSEPEAALLVYDFVNVQTIVYDNQGWMMVSNMDKAIEDVASWTGLSEDKSVAGDNRRARRLTAGGMANIVATIPVAMEKGQPMVCVTVNAEGNTLTAESETMYADGSEFATEGFGEIDTKQLKYLPKKPNYVLATALDGTTDWSSILNNIGQMLPRNERSSLGMVMPYLSALKGNIVLGAQLHAGANPESRNFNPLEDADFIIMVGVESGMRQQMLSMFEMMAPNIGNNFTKLEAGLYSLRAEGATLYGGEINGALFIANYDPRKADSDVDTGLFKGQNLAMMVDLPANTLKSLPFALDVTLRSHDSKGSLKMELPGTDDKIMNQLLLNIR